MKVIRSNIKYLLICPLIFAFFISTPVEASDSFQENKEEVEETKIYYRIVQSVKQKPRNNANAARPKTEFAVASPVLPEGSQPQQPRYILYCNLIFYE